MADRHPRENEVSSNTERIILNGTQSFENDDVDDAILLELWLLADFIKNNVRLAIGSHPNSFM